MVLSSRQAGPLSKMSGCRFWPDRLARDCVLRWMEQHVVLCTPLGEGLGLSHLSLLVAGDFLVAGDGRVCVGWSRRLVK